MLGVLDIVNSDTRNTIIEILNVDYENIKSLNKVNINC